MRRTIGLTFFLWGILISYSQEIKPIFINEIDSVQLEKFNDQGFKMFKRSKCYDKKSRYFSIPEFMVSSKAPLDLLTFENNNFLSHLFIAPQSKFGLLNEMSWYFFLKRNDAVISVSDLRKFNCFINERIFEDIKRFDNLVLTDIAYVFQIYNVDGFITFIVLKNQNILVHLYKERKIQTLEEFNSMYENATIKRFTDEF